MRYLGKRADSIVASNAWRYPRDATKIREALLSEQQGFCAYSERHVRKTDQTEVEHFDPRLKEQPEDGYGNWYAVLAWMNRHKCQGIERFEPMVRPDSDLRARIRYVKGLFQPINAQDTEARNFIDFIGWNCRELFEDRQTYVKRIRDLIENLGADWADLCGDPAYCEFATALEAELGLKVPEAARATK